MREFFARLGAPAAGRSDQTAISDDRGAVSYRALAARVAALAESLPASARTVAIGGRAGASWIVADLSATLAGRRVVPVPSFFSRAQVRHVLADGGAQLLLDCDAGCRDLESGSALVRLEVDGHAPAAPRTLPGYRGAAQRVIYTSGTTGARAAARRGARGSLDAAGVASIRRRRRGAGAARAGARRARRRHPRDPRLRIVRMRVGGVGGTPRRRG